MVMSGGLARFRLLRAAQEIYGEIRRADRLLKAPDGLLVSQHVLESELPDLVAAQEAIERVRIGLAHRKELAEDVAARFGAGRLG